MLLLIEEAFLFFALLVNSNKDALEFINYAIPIGILLILCDPWLLTSVISFSWVALIICIIGELFRNTRLNSLTKGFMVVGGIAWGVNYLQLIEYGTFTNKIILLGIAVYYLFRTKKSFYKYLAHQTSQQILGFHHFLIRPMLHSDFGEFHHSMNMH